MEPLALALIVVGVVAMVLGALRIRAPLATIGRLDATAENLERYDAWRGRDTSVQAEGPTGADEMRAFMRRRAILWGGLIGTGIALIAVGLLVR